MTTKHINLALVEGEILNVANSPHLSIPRMNITGTSIIASTKKMEGVILLDRKHFVKPKVDVEELAQYIYPYKKDGLSDNDKDTLKMFAGIWKSGYNFKEAEFTMEDMEKAIFAGYGMFYDDDTHDKVFEDLIKEIRPLSLPKSVMLNENNELISVEWT